MKNPNTKKVVWQDNQRCSKDREPEQNSRHRIRNVHCTFKCRVLQAVKMENAHDTNWESREGAETLRR